MTINRRRAPSSLVSSTKKLAGHANEVEFASFINGITMAGTGKTDVVDNSGLRYSVKSGKKWQIFLYSYDRINSSKTLRILKPCLDAFPEDYEKYRKDRELCIEFKEDYIRKNGRLKASNLGNEEVHKKLGSNSYIEAKLRLALETVKIKNILSDVNTRKKFLDEAIFNEEEVNFLSIKDEILLSDKKFKVFSKGDVLSILSGSIFPEVSQAGRVSEDFNVSGQKTLFCYMNNGKPKNIVEIEIRNDSQTHYRQVRFNMYSKDTLKLLYKGTQDLEFKDLHQKVRYFGKAVSLLK